MAVSVPPMTYGVTAVLVLYVDFGALCRPVPSVDSAPAIRRVSSAVGTERVAGLVLGVGTAVAALAEDPIRAAVTAAATPAVATDSAKRVRCR